MKLIGYLVVLGAIIFGVGLFLDWWSFSKETTPDGETKWSLKVDDEKLKKDTSKVTAKVGDITKKVGESISKLGKEKMTGQVALFSNGKLVVEGSDGTPKTFEFQPATEVKVGDTVCTDMSEIRPGKAVTVHYDDNNGTSVATHVVVEP